MDFRNPTIFKASDTKRATIADTETISDEVVFNKRYAFFKITPMDDTGIPAAADIELLENGKVVISGTAQVMMTYPDEDFIWYAILIGGADKISLRLSAAATADIVFQVTGFEEAQ